MPPDTVVIVNPSSAGGQTRRRWPQLERTLRDTIGPFQPLFTERRGHATDLTRRALRDGVELVVSMGGDGTLNEVINGFFESDGESPEPVRPGATFGLLPAGTGGDFPKTLGMPRDFESAARMLAASRPRPIDVGRMTYLDHDGSRRMRHFVNIASFGISGLVVRYVNNSSKALGGKASFLLASLRATLAYHNARVSLRLDDGEPEEQPIHLVAVANGRFFGGGMKVAPDAEYDDGRFDVVTLGDASTATMLLHGTKIYSGAHLKLPFVSVRRAVKVSAESLLGEEVLLDVDGEQPGRLPATFELLPAPVQVMTTA